MIRLNPEGEYPQIDNTAYIDPVAVITGKVEIGGNAFVGTGVMLKADEKGSSITIKDNCNIQDSPLCQGRVLLGQPAMHGDPCRSSWA